MLKADYLLDDGPTKTGIESTILAISDNTIEIMRPGIITMERLTADFPNTRIVPTSENGNIKSPGQMKSHYAPNKPLILLDNIPENLPENSGLILFNSSKIPINSSCKITYLSKNNNLTEAAANLFSALHKLENDTTIETIYAVKINEEGIGLAIMDKLYKASYNYLHLSHQK
jgi:L-threonylcarbamoyladenylate synthase